MDQTWQLKMLRMETRRKQKKTREEMPENHHLLGQQALLLGLGEGDLVNEQSNTALGNDVGHAVTNLDRHHSRRCASAKHGEQVDNWVCAPADDGHHLRSLDLALDRLISLTVGGSGETDKQLIHNEDEEHHRDEPADPTRSEVTSDNQLTVVA